MSNEHHDDLNGQSNTFCSDFNADRTEATILDGEGNVLGVVKGPNTPEQPLVNTVAELLSHLNNPVDEPGLDGYTASDIMMGGVGMPDVTLPAEVRIPNDGGEGDPLAILDTFEEAVAVSNALNRFYGEDSDDGLSDTRH